MNKRKILVSLKNIANSLDNSGFNKEATSLTNLMKRFSKFDNWDDGYDALIASHTILTLINMANQQFAMIVIGLKMMNKRLCLHQLMTLNELYQKIKI
jgi:hypothetical protein